MPERAGTDPEATVDAARPEPARASGAALTDSLAGAPSAQAVLRLQRSIGNAAVARAIARRPRAGVTPARRLARRDGKPEVVTVVFNVTPDVAMTGEEFFIRAVMQYEQIGREDAKQRIHDGKFTCSHPACADGVAPDVVGQPVPVSIQVRAMSKAEKAAAAKTTRWLAGLPAAERDELNAETDRRFWARGHKPGQKLGTGTDEEGLRQQWLRERDAVLRDKSRVESLAPAINDFLRTGGQSVRPADYTTVLRIADKAAALTAAERAEYQSRVTARTSDWATFEASLDRFIAERRERETTATQRRDIETRLFGLEALYKRYRNYLSMLKGNARLAGLGQSSPQAAGAALGGQLALDKVRSELDADLVAAGFPGGITEFESTIRAYEAVFDRETRAVANVMLDQYAHLLWTQEERYRAGSAADDLYKALAATSARADYETAEKIRDEHAMGVVLTPEEMADQAYWVGKRNEALARAEAAVRSVAKEHPLVAERKFDRERLARAAQADVGPVMLGYIAARKADIAKTRRNLADKPRMIFGLKDLLDASLVAQGIESGSLLHQIIRDHVSDENWTDAIPDFVLAIVAIAAGLLTGGGGTVAVLAAGTALGIGAYQAIEEFRRYEMKSAAAGAGLLSEDPSMAWAIVAVIGAGFDAAALFSALPKLRPAIQAFNQGSEAGDIAALSAKLEKLKDVEEGIRTSVIKAAGAELEARAAWRSILRPPAALRAVVVPLAEEFGRFVYAVYLTVKRGIRDFRVFAKTNEAVELIGDVAKLSAEELKLLKQGYLKAVGEMEAVAAHGKALGMADKDVSALMKMRAESKGMTAEQVIEEMDLLAATKGKGLTVEVTEKQWARLRRVRDALNDETKWVNVTPKDRWRLGRVYDKLLEELVSEGVRRTGQKVLHYSELTPELIKDLRKAGKRVLITEGRMPSQGLRLDMVEIDFAKGRAELLDITATQSAAHLEKTRQGKKALEELVGMPVEAKELYYTGPKGELLDTLVEVPVK